jgi:hypothetical protein
MSVSPGLTIVSKGMRGRLVNQVLGNLVRLHHPSMVTLPGNGHRELATTWEHYRIAPDGKYRTTQGAVAHDFWVSIFSMHDFFFIIRVC